MKSEFNGGSFSNGGAYSKLGATSYISEHHTKAYLIARDTIRRIRRTTCMVESLSKGACQMPEGKNRRQDLP